MTAEEEERATLAKIRAEARTALLSWLALDAPAMLSPDGRAMVWTDGKPVALDVLAALRELER